MSNEELVALIQAGERDRLSELWDNVEKFARREANKRPDTPAVSREEVLISVYL